jgi:hypothetical protein
MVLKLSLVKCHFTLCLSFFLLSTWPSAPNQSQGQTKDVVEEPLGPERAPSMLRLRPALSRLPAPGKFDDALIHEKMQSIAPFPYRLGLAQKRIWSTTLDPFLVKKSFDCSDFKLLKDKLMQVVESIGMSVVDADEPGAFSERLPDKPGSRYWDVVEVTMSWSKTNQESASTYRCYTNESTGFRQKTTNLGVWNQGKLGFKDSRN